MLPPYFDIQSIPNITSNPCDSKIIRSDGKTWLPMVRGIWSHHRLAIYSAPSELTNKGVLRVWVGSLNLSTNPLDMYECDAPVSKRTRAVNDLTKNLPITASGCSSTSSHVNVVHLSFVEWIRILSRAPISVSILSFRALRGIVSSLLALEASDVT